MTCSHFVHFDYGDFDCVSVDLPNLIIEVDW